MFIDLEQLILDYGDLKISKRQLMSQLTAADYIKLAGKIKKAAEFRSAKITARNLEVIYINGKSGSGKTVFAKYLAEQLHFDFFVSGSGEDFLDGYDKEECIILDDYEGLENGVMCHGIKYSKVYESDGKRISLWTKQDNFVLVGE